MGGWEGFGGCSHNDDGDSHTSTSPSLREVRRLVWESPPVIETALLLKMEIATPVCALARNDGEFDCARVDAVRAKGSLV